MSARGLQPTRRGWRTTRSCCGWPTRRETTRETTRETRLRRRWLWAEESWAPPRSAGRAAGRHAAIGDGEVVLSMAGMALQGRPAGSTVVFSMGWLRPSGRMSALRRRRRSALIAPVEQVSIRTAHQAGATRPVPLAGAAVHLATRRGTYPPVPRGTFLPRRSATVAGAAASRLPVSHPGSASVESEREEKEGSPTAETPDGPVLRGVVTG